MSTPIPATENANAPDNDEKQQAVGLVHCTVGQLIEFLKTCDPNAVVVSHPMDMDMHDLVFASAEKDRGYLDNETNQFYSADCMEDHDVKESLQKKKMKEVNAVVISGDRWS